MAQFKLLLPKVSDVTQILNQLNDGQQQPSDELLPLVYSELKRIAAQKMRLEAPGHTLQPTALVHEAWITLSANNARFVNRAHFFASAAEAMRRILVDSARRKLAAKRGAGSIREEIQEDHWVEHLRSDEVLAVHEALEQLAREDPVSAELVKLRYFAGMNMAEAASALDLPLRSAERLWTFARAWLRRAISAEQ